jgi:eukaryotic-like serine/threonine-protein kinase
MRTDMNTEPSKTPPTASDGPQDAPAGESVTVAMSSPATGEDYSAAGLREGQVIDGYRLEQKLHIGGMAHVWRVTAVNNPPDVPLVMKVPRIKGGEDPATIVGFEVEQMILPALSGPHVPRYFARGDFTRLPYIVMEQIDGVSLRPKLDKAPLPLDEVIEIGSRVAVALHELHRQHLVHLDIKPSNILFRPDGTAVMVDFGLSRHDHLPDLLEEEFSLPMGTGPYMSPEQVQFVRNDPRSDLFALGVMLYHFTTGERPFGSPDSVRGLRKRLYTDPIPPRALRADCPPWLQELILKCLEVNPERRWQSAAQLAMALQNPGQIALTSRASRMKALGAWLRFRRWFRALGAEPKRMAQEGAISQVMKSAIIMAAVDLDNADEGLLSHLRETVRRVLSTEPSARLACVTVRRVARLGMEERVDDEGRSLHIKQLIGLQHWARPIVQQLKMEDGQLTFHVLESPDPAEAIVDFAERNHIDHIVMGARGASALRRYLGSVSSEVVAKSSCTVTVVRH